MYLVNFDPASGRVLGAGLVDDSVLPKTLPEGTVAVESLPEGRATDYFYRDGQFVPVLQGGDGA